MFKKIKEKLENIIFNEITNYIENNWQKPFGFILFVSLIFGFIVIPGFKYLAPYLSELSKIMAINERYLKVVLFSISYLSIFLIVFQKLKYPITSRKKIGIYIAISNRFKDDESSKFINKIHKEIDNTLNSLGFGDIFNVVILDEYKSQKIIRGQRNFWDPKLNKSKWGLNLNKSRWRFLLYGSVKNARNGIESDYKLELDYAVTHAPIDGRLSLSIGKELKGFLDTQKWQFPISQEMDALEISAGNIKENVLFSLGLSAYVSGLINIARSFHEKLFDLIKPRVQHEKNLGKINNKLKGLLVKENHILGNYFYSQGDLNSAISFQEKALMFNPNYYWAHLNLAQHYYLKGKNYKNKVDFHLGEAEKHPADSSHKLSQAFLLMDRDERFKEGAELYIKTLRSGSLREDVIKETLVFIEKELENTSKNYLLFVKGLIYKFRINEEKSKEFFREFTLKNEQELNYSYLIEKSKVYSLN